MNTFGVPLDIGLATGLVMSFAVIGLAIAYRLLSFPDITVEGSLVLGAATYATCIRLGFEVPGSLAAGCLAGAAAGVLTAVLHLRASINKFLAAILTVAIAYSLSLRIMGAPNLGLRTAPTLFDHVEGMNRWSQPLHAGSAVLLALIAFSCIVLLLLFLSARGGVKLRVVGSNLRHARALGLATDAYIILGLAATNALAGFSGVLLAMQQGFVDVGMGQGILIIALSALVIGERLLPERHVRFHVFVVLSALAGSIVYECIVAIAIQLGVAPTDLKLATAALLIAVMTLGKRGQDDLLLG